MALKNWKAAKTVNVAKWENKKNGHTLTVGEATSRGNNFYVLTVWTGSDLKPVTNRVQKVNIMKAAKEYMLKH